VRRRRKKIKRAGVNKIGAGLSRRTLEGGGDLGSPISTAKPLESQWLGSGLVGAGSLDKSEH